MSGIVKIHGKSYKTVALRVAEFRQEYTVSDGWGIITTLMHHDEDTVVMKAEIVNPAGMVVGTGHGEEKRSASQINRTSAMENAETSAIGRCLATISAGLQGVEFATADELVNALHQQGGGKRAASDKQKKFLHSLILKLPKGQQAAYIDKAKEGDAQTISNLIEELKNG